MSTSLIDRLEARSMRRQRAGAAGRADLRISRLTGLSSAFYARFGMADPWASSLDEPTRDDDGLHFLSGKRYYARMRRLALSRWWRERRRHEFMSRRPGRETAARKRFPGEARRGFSWGISLSEGSMVLPPPIEAPASEEEEDAQPVKRVSPWGTVRASVSDSPWHVTPWRPARVAPKKPREQAPEVMVIDRTQDRPVVRPAPRPPQGTPRRHSTPVDRPAQRVGRRLAAASAGRDPVIQAVQAAAPLLDTRARRELTRVLERTVTLDVRTRVIEVQKVIRKVTSARVVREVLQDVAPPQTASRSARTRGRSTGLRPVMASSGAWSETTASTSARPVATAALRGTADSVRLSAAPVQRRRAAGPSTALRATRGARVVRTAAGEFVPASTHTTDTSDTAGARLGTRRARASAPGVTRSGQWVGTSSAQTTQRDWFAQATSAPLAGSGVFRTATGEWHGASSFTTDKTPFRRSALHRTQRGRFVGAQTGTKPSREWTPARLGSSNWAAQRLESTGRPGKTRGGRKSLLPRMAPRVAPEGVVVVHAETTEEAEQIAAQVRHMGASARISKSPWHITPFRGARVVPKKPAHTAPAVAAAERAVSLPALAATLTRVITRQVQAAARSQGPLVHTRSTPVSSAAVIRQLESGDWEGARSSKTPRGSWSGANTFTTSAGEWTGARSGTSRASGLTAAGVFTTASGELVSARSLTTGSSAITGARVLTTSSGDFIGAHSGTTGSSRFVRARTGVTARGQWTGARTGRTRAAWGLASDFTTPEFDQAAPAPAGKTRPTDWMGARVAFGQGSSAYRGAFQTKTPRSDFGGAGVFGTPRGAWNGARRTRTPLGWHHAPDMQMPEREMTDTLASMAHGTPHAGIPGWAERSDRPHRIRASGELINQLANARDPKAVVEIIVQRGAELRNTRLPKPVIQVIEQIQTVSRESGDAKQSLQDRVRSARSDLNNSPRRGNFRRGTRSSATVINGWTGLRPGQSASTSQSAVGADKVMKLAAKLKNLIHLAQGGNTAEAQRHAKLAHANRPDQSMERGGDIGSSETAFRQSVDIEALGREVMEVVNREQESRQERRQEDNDGSIWW